MKYDLQTPLLDKVWFNMDGVKIPNLREGIKQRLKLNREMGYKQLVCIGTDSQVIESDSITTVVTSIVILREGHGGNCFNHKERLHRTMSIKERMLYESHQSVMIAYDLRDLFEAEDIDLELHADINTNPTFKSNIALKEAMGYVLGMGFTFKSKPDAFASSYVANKFTKN